MAIRGILIALIIFTAVALGMVINIMSGSEPVENNPSAELLTEEEVLDVRRGKAAQRTPHDILGQLV